MRLSKNVLFVLILILTLSFFCACSSQGDELVIYSTDYPGVHKLTAGEVDLEKIKKHPWSDSGEYWNMHCSVSKSYNYDQSSEMLIVSNYEEWNTHKVIGCEGLLFGEDYKEHSSGVFYCPKNDGNSSSKNVITLLTDRCVGLYLPDSSKGETVYAITAWNYWEEPYHDYTSLYKLVWQGADAEIPYLAEKICDISTNISAVASAITNDGKIYVLTQSSIFEVTLEGSVREISCPKEFQYYGGDSIVEIGGRLFIGCYTGILRYDINEQEFTWFPVDYARIVTSK